MPSKQQKAKLRVCASCEWIQNENPGCPKCGFGTYGAFYVYGKKAYQYRRTQRPWLDRKLADHETKLRAEIEES